MLAVARRRFLRKTKGLKEWCSVLGDDVMATADAGTRAAAKPHG